MPYSVAAKNKMLDALGVTVVSLHSANPGSTGANELSGGSPAYARKSITQATAAAGATAASTQPVFDVPAGSTVAFVGYWSGATYLGYDDVTSETFAAQGTYTLTGSTLDLNATASA